jgi:hypothetical protein
MSDPNAEKIDKKLNETDEPGPAEELTESDAEKVAGGILINECTHGVK